MRPLERRSLEDRGRLRFSCLRTRRTFQRLAPGRVTTQLAVSMRQVHRAGEKLFIDYSGKKLRIADRGTGEVMEVEIFVAVLGASNYTYAEATRTQKLPDFVGSTVRAFRNSFPQSDPARRSVRHADCSRASRRGVASHRSMGGSFSTCSAEHPVRKLPRKCPGESAVNCLEHPGLIP
jgi:hypothetical protein